MIHTHQAYRLFEVLSLDSHIFIQGASFSRWLRLDSYHMLWFDVFRIIGNTGVVG